VASFKGTPFFWLFAFCFKYKTALPNFHPNSGQTMYEKIKTYCLDKNEVTEEYPFGPEVAVYKVAGKMFALVDVPNAVSINLKCEPALAQQLREAFAGVTPGYHMNKEHWNTVMLDGSVDLQMILAWIDLSYELVVKKMQKKDQTRLLGN
jgi:predicted DNA-binding protein (MmcQ/YjbR family)